jgi:hypothetical protein
MMPQKLPFNFILDAHGIAYENIPVRGCEAAPVPHN